MEARLALIEVLGRDGRVRARHPVRTWPVRVGRAFDCDLVLDDPHLAACHAELSAGDEGQVTVTARESLNGVHLERELLAPGVARALSNGALLRLGQTTLRVRWAGEALAPERAPVRVTWRAGLRDALLLALALAAFLGNEWLDGSIDRKATAYLADALLACTLALAWSGAWGLADKLFQGRFRLLPHLRLAGAFVLAALLADEGMRGLAFALAWGLPSRMAPWVQAGCLAWLLREHLALVLPAQGRRLTRAAVALYLGVLATGMALQWQEKGRPFSEPYTATVGPPFLRLARPVAPAVLLEEAGALRQRLDREAREEGEGEE